MSEKLFIDVGSTYFKVSTSKNIEQHFRDFNKDILDDLLHKCGETIEPFEKEQVHIWRRSYDIPPPGGESLKNTAERVLPYFNEVIMPRLMSGENVLIAAHGNSLRSLVMQLDNLSKEEVLSLEIPTGAPILYSFNGEPSPSSKENLF